MNYDYYYYKDENDNIIPIHELNVVRPPYVEGIDELEKMISDIIKVPQEELEKERRQMLKAPLFALDGELTENRLHPNDIIREQDIRDKNNTTGATIRNVEGLGLQAIYNGTVMKEFSLEDESDTDSGLRKKIFIRWDLICQIFNRLIIPEYKENEPLVELTYLTRDTPTYKQGTNTEGPGSTTKHPGGGYYIPYSKESRNVVLPLDEVGLTDNQVFMDLVGEPGEDDMVLKLEGKEDFQQTQYLLSSDTKAYFQKYGYHATINITKGTIEFPPLLGRSYDRNVCLMPHQLPQMTEQLGGPSSVVTTDDHTSNIILKTKNQKNFTSFQDVIAEANSIGHVFFNLDYLISTYESISLEEYKTQTDLGKEITKRRLKKRFSVHNFITTIWNGVNDACGGYYDFGLHTEHERPNIARIIDFTMSGASSDINKDLFSFNPQGLYSVTRDNFFQSKLDNDFASVVSIAAQAPDEINSLEAVSFKAFHKGIKSRFTVGEKKDWSDDPENIKAALLEYQNDYIEYENSVRSLLLYINRMNQSNYEYGYLKEQGSEDKYVQRPISTSTAKSMAARLESQRISLLNRNPEVDENGVRYDENHPDGHFTGQYRDDLTNKGAITFNRNAIIPLTSTLSLDGISGINPLNIYKINSDKLPLAYTDPNIVFCVKKEHHKITPGQDWTVNIEGYLTLLNDNPTTGTNPTITTIDLTPDPELDEIDDGWQNWYEFIHTGSARWPNSGTESEPQPYYWSAVFISWAVQKAVGAPKWNRGFRHTMFFENNKDTAHFEHLDPKKTELQLGDICLKKRQGSYAVTYPGPYEGVSHSDIIIGIERIGPKSDKKGKVTLVGGNVSNMVEITEVEIYLEESGSFTGVQMPPHDDPTLAGGPNAYLNAGQNHDFYGGSILRSKESSGIDARNIAMTAENEYRYWPKRNGERLTEADPECEDIIRKYISNYPPGALGTAWPH